MRPASTLTFGGALFAVAALASACGGAEKSADYPTSSRAPAPPAPPPPSGGAYPQPQQGAPAQGYPAPPSAPETSAPQPTSPALGPLTAPPRGDGTREALRAELERAERGVRLEAGDCATTCRALASMERATDHLCRLGADAEDLCSDAKRRIRAARNLVRAGCGTCPGGPSVDPSAPIPSGTR